VRTPNDTIDDHLIGGEYLNQYWMRHFVPGMTYRQLDYWTRRGYLASMRRLKGSSPPNQIVPEGPELGSGTDRLWHAADIPILRRVIQLLCIGCTPQLAFRLARQPGPTVRATHDVTLTFEGDLAHAYPRTA
jgi:hypothetical protein